MESREKPPALWPWLIAFIGFVFILLVCDLVFTLGAGSLWWRLSGSRKVLDHTLVFSRQALSAQESWLHSPQGFVEVQDKSGNWLIITQDHKIAAGQHVRTGLLSSILLVFSDGSRAFLGPETEISIDHLDLQGENGSRRIALTQITGKSEHDIVPSGGETVYYEVRTPSGTGVAKGTRFQVAVTSDQAGRFSVEQGAVAVTGMDVTVMVEAGEVTTVYPDQAPSDPVFRIFGEGVVEQTGETWMIDGEAFKVHEASQVVGEPQIGDVVYVEGRLLPDETRLADWILLIQSSPSNQFKLTGSVEAIAETGWVISGQSVTVSGETTLEEGAQVGSWVSVEGLILEGGTLQATRIRTVLEGTRLQFEFTGVVQEISPAFWKVSGVIVAVGDQADVDQDLSVGEVVKVWGWIQEDNHWLASHIERAQVMADPFELTGRLESMQPWRVAGILLETGEWTEIDDGLRAGDLVQVKGQIQPDGTWLAVEIERVKTEASAQLVLIGPVLSLDPWVVNGIPLTIGEAAVIEANISAGSLVRVEIHLLPDGTWQVIRITLLEAFEPFPTCTTVTAVVVGVEGNQIQLSGWPVLVLEEGVEIDGDLAPDSTVRLQVCFDAELVVRIISIVVLEPPVIDNPPPVEEGGKLTICHKPYKKKGGNTISISRSALPAHLGHGDTVGTCSP